MSDASYPSPEIQESRRLTGPNLFSDRPGAVLEVACAEADLPARVAAWEAEARALSRELGWPEPSVASRCAGATAMLYLSAPVEVLMTATEVNEHAWAAAATGARTAELAGLAAAAEAERAARGALGGAYREAVNRGVMAAFDDETLILGGGADGRVYPADAIPAGIGWEGIRNVPTALITGSNGKTTVTRLMAAIWGRAGATPGYCCTDGVWVDGVSLETGDYSGPGGARAVLRDPRVQVAVLETARGGMLRRGLAATRADAAIITNISADHFGEYGVTSLDDLARAKAIVARALGEDGALVLNADDPTLVALGARLGRDIRWFSAAGAAHADASVIDGRLRLRTGSGEYDLGEVAVMPLTLNGVARHNVANLAAAALLASAMGAPLDAIRDTLQTFGLAPSDNPGRLQLFRVNGATVLLDYAHNPDGLAALCTTARAFPAERRLLMLGHAGDRDDDMVRAMTRAAWEVLPFDRVVVKEMESLLRGREAGDLPQVFSDELVRLGLPRDALEVVGSELEGVRRALSWARPGDLLILPVHAEREAVLREIASRAPGAAPAGG